ncbi:TIGR02281 family clan AA aspartic protease [Roseibium denhamense]|uniref:Aspartyl protease family protein n=1 Tax=Roseibium denhamense TaxID=76305 RepID=A0ABY1NZS0_9HYPH|nr:TIGR02281 family clan AA aspartic protease [Roseibium denhamense]MTI05097.1 TIGR02281 family clan AA aspartic protease [Roseibium denhamense]SMP22880.1 aspartyl protease family protein [Roseibium denhamense]
MWRFIVIFLFCAALAPLVPYLADRYVAPEAPQGDQNGRTSTSVDRTHRIPVSRNGQYFATALLNGRRYELLVDTGASSTALPRSVAEDVGVYPDDEEFKYRVNTANGTTSAARVVIRSFEMGDIFLRDVEALVLQDESLSKPLLGMSVLSRLERFDISNSTLVLVQ